MPISTDLLEELKLSSQIKSAFYNYFYRIFKEPVGEDFIGVTEKFLPHFEELTEFIETDRMKNAVALIKEYALEEKNAKDMNAFFDSLNIQYTGLYLLGSSSVPTSASVYLSPDKLLKREPWEKICAIYKSRGFKMPQGFNEPEDHIAMELLYMQKLNDLVLTLIDENMTDKIKDALEEQKQFIDNEMLIWVNEFVNLTTVKASKSNSKLHGPAAIIMEEFLKYDSGLTQELREALG